MVTENHPAPSSMLSAISVLDSLIRAGMRHIVLSPGSRSAPLAYAAAAAEEAGALITHVRVDERSAAFTALGIAKASGRPTGLVCTSGTALGEYVPAVMEAYHSGVPLAVVSADRPERLRGSGANQTTFQRGFFGHFVRAEADLISYPEREAGAQTAAFKECLAALTGRDAQDWSRASDSPLGPVHINLCLDAPLTPDKRIISLLPQWAQSLNENIDFTAEAKALRDRLGLGQNPAPLSPIEKGWLLERQHRPLQNNIEAPQAPRTVVIAGDGAEYFAAEFAKALNLPLLAEPSSGVRGGHTSIPHYIELLGDRACGQPGAAIERVVLFGHPTLSRPVAALLEREQVPVAHYAPRQASWYEPGMRNIKAISFPEDLAIFALKGAEKGDNTWLSQWVSAATVLATTHHNRILHWKETPDQPPQKLPDTDRTAGQAVAIEIWERCAKDGAALVLGSSNLIRDLDTVAPGLGASSPIRVYANRGLAGIDGTIATAIGVSLAGYYPTSSAGNDGQPSAGGEPTPVRLLCGDLTFQHDISSLNLPATELMPHLEVHVFDDGGGSIFASLEHGRLASQKQFKRTLDRFFTVRADATTDLARMASGFGTDSGITVSVHKP